MRPVLLLLIGATLALAACGGDDVRHEKTPAASKAAGPTWPPSRPTCLDHTQRLAGDIATLKDERAAVPRPGRAEQLRHQEDARRPPGGGRQAPRRRQEDLRRRQPRLRGDGGRRGRRAVARRLRRDHRRRRRRLGSRERGAVLDQDRGRQDLQAARQPVLPAESSLYGTESKWSTKADVDGDGKVEFGEALPEPRFYLAAIERVRQAGQGARRLRASSGRRPSRTR